MGIFKTILKSVLQILKKNCLKIDVGLFFKKYQKLSIGRTARFREIYDRKKVSYDLRACALGGKSIRRCARALRTACTDLFARA